MLGHSMGSFLLRQDIQNYGKELTGAIVMGTGYKPYPWLWQEDYFVVRSVSCGRPLPEPS